VEAVFTYRIVLPTAFFCLVHFVSFPRSLHLFVLSFSFIFFVFSTAFVGISQLHFFICPRLPNISVHPFLLYLSFLLLIKMTEPQNQIHLKVEEVDVN